MNSAVTPDRPWLDLAYQLANNLLPFCDPIPGAVPAVADLAAADAVRGGPSVWTAAASGATSRGGRLRVAVILGPALGFYLLARQLGINTTIVMADLGSDWWTIPMYCLAAFQNGFLEEVVMIGYLTTRWRQSGWHPGAAIAVSALIRGSYHLYQGFGGFISNLVFGLLLGWLYQRTRRLWPLVIAHTVIDITAFVGYSLLAGVVGWL